MENQLDEAEIAELKQCVEERRERMNRPGLFPDGKYFVQRLDGRDGPGEKHEMCWYFVLDVTHDPHSIAALEAYAESCKAEYPQLSHDLRIRAADAQHSGVAR